MARRLLADGTEELVPAAALAKGDLVVCEAGDHIPSDGEIIEGVASVDESAITGESAPVIRESGGDRSAVTGGTTVLSDRIVVRITAEAGQTFLDRMIALVEGANRQKTPNEIALTILLAVLTIIFLPVVVVLQPFGHFAGGDGLGGDPGLAAGLPHPDHHRCPAVRHRHRRHGPPGAAQRAGHERPGRRGGRRRADPAAGQDGHHHPGQPHGLGLLPRQRPHRGGGRRARPSWRPWPTRRPRDVPSLSWPRSASTSASASSRVRHEFVPFSATTRMSGLNVDGRQIRKGAAEAVRQWVVDQGGAVPEGLQDIVDRIARAGLDAPRRGRGRQHPRRHRAQGRREVRASRSASPSCAPPASAP